MQSHQYQDAIFASNLSSNAKLVALAIAYHYNWKEGNKAFPSIRLLVERTGLSKATIHRSKNELVSQGYLVSERRFNDSNLYLPQIPSPSQSETLVVSQGRTNYEYNYEVNYELKGPVTIVPDPLVINNKLSQEEIWDIFEGEKRNDAPRPKTNRRSNSNNRQHDQGPRRNHISDAELTEFNTQLAEWKLAQW